MSIFSWFSGLFSGFALGDRRGKQQPVPATSLVENTTALSPDGALQIAAVWACVERIAKTVATLPLYTALFKIVKTDLPFSLFYTTPDCLDILFSDEILQDYNRKIKPLF